MKTNLILLLAAMPLWLSAQKEVETTATITEVMVYTSSAEVNYEKEIALPRGQTVVVFTGLTPYIVPNSVNVSVGDPALHIITVAERINYTRPRKDLDQQVQGLQDSVKRLTRELGLVRCRLDAASTEQELLFKDEAIGGLSTRGVAVAEIEKASAFFSKRYYELSKALLDDREKEQELKERRKRCESQIGVLSGSASQNSSEIRVTVNNPADKPVKFQFRFLTSRGGWAPVYDFRYEGPGKPLGFVFRANVFNASGTPWQDVRIRLSTANPMAGFAMPSLSEPVASTKKEATTIDGVKFKTIELVNAITEYTIAHQYSIPSDARPYLVDVATNSMPASFSYLLIPKLDPFGFLMAKVPNWNAYNLIPGEANIYNMGSYMGKTFLDTYAANDTLGLYLGKDKSIQAIRSETQNYNPRNLIGNYSVEKVQTVITIKNTTANALAIELIDQVPYFDKDDKEKFSIWDIDAAVYTKSDGMLKWRFTLQATETKTLSFGYEIKTPRDLVDQGRGKKRKYRTIACPSF